MKNVIAKSGSIPTGSVQPTPSVPQTASVVPTNGLAAQTAATGQAPSQIEVPRSNGFMLGGTDNSSNGLAYIQSMQNAINKY